MRQFGSEAASKLLDCNCLKMESVVKQVLILLESNKGTIPGSGLEALLLILQRAMVQLNNQHLAGWSLSKQDLVQAMSCVLGCKQTTPECKALATAIMDKLI